MHPNETAPRKSGQTLKMLHDCHVTAPVKQRNMASMFDMLKKLCRVEMMIEVVERKKTPRPPRAFMSSGLSC